VLEVIKVLMVKSVHLDLRVYRDNLDQSDTQELLERRVMLDHLVTPDQKARLAHLD